MFDAVNLVPIGAAPIAEGAVGPVDTHVHFDDAGGQRFGSDMAQLALGHGAEWGCAWLAAFDTSAAVCELCLLVVVPPEAEAAADRALAGENGDDVGAGALRAVALDAPPRVRGALAAALDRCTA